MDFKQIDVYADGRALTSLSHKLSSIGITGFVIHDSSDFNAFLNDKEANWDYIDDGLMKLSETSDYLTFYLPDNSQGSLMFDEMSVILKNLRENEQDFYGDLHIEINSVREEDWENCWKEYYKPLKIGNRIIIKPTWENADDVINGQDSMLVLEMDPASAFGTGQHSTTQLCIEALEEFMFDGAKVLDLGCGSGILSIAALLLGAEYAVAVDIMENAVKVTNENLTLNGFGAERCKTFCGNIIKDENLRGEILGMGGFDIITANIVADVIIAMSGFAASFLKPGGIIIFSGIITDRLPEIKAALSGGGFIIKETREKDDWRAVICTINK